MPHERRKHGGASGQATSPGRRAKDPTAKEIRGWTLQKSHPLAKHRPVVVQGCAQQASIDEGPVVIRTIEKRPEVLDDLVCRPRFQIVETRAPDCPKAWFDSRDGGAAGDPRLNEFGSRFASNPKHRSGAVGDLHVEIGIVVPRTPVVPDHQFNAQLLQARPKLRTPNFGGNARARSDHSNPLQPIASIRVSGNDVRLRPVIDEPIGRPLKVERTLHEGQITPGRSGPIRADRDDDAVLVRGAQKHPRRADDIDRISARSGVDRDVESRLAQSQVGRDDPDVLKHEESSRWKRLKSCLTSAVEKFRPS